MEGAKGPHTGHAGFLSSAEAILPVLLKHLEGLLGGSSDIKHVLFTGHSAGGAVASLLFANFLCKSAPECKCLAITVLFEAAEGVKDMI